MGKKKDKKSSIQKPDPMRKDWRIRNVDSGMIYLLESWLEEESKETGNTISDTFNIAVYDFLLEKWGIEKIRKRNSEYDDQQRKLSNAYAERFDCN